MGRTPFSNPVQYFLIVGVGLFSLILYLTFFIFLDVEGKLSLSLASPSTYCGSRNSHSMKETTPTTSTMTVTVTPTPKPFEPEPAYCNYCSPTDEACKRYGSFNLARSRAYEGSNARLKRVLRKLRSGQKIKIGIVGGSVSIGYGLQDRRDNWSYLYAEHVRDMFAESTSSNATNIEVELINGSVSGTISQYMETCFREHIPEDVDLVIIELAINDQRLEYLAQGYEHLIRSIFALPQKPAVINVQVMALMFPTITMGGDLHTAVAEYYDTSIISIRNVLLPHILRSTHLKPSDNSLEDYWFGHDIAGGLDLRHVSKHGHRMIADLLQSFTSRVACEGWHEDQLIGTYSEDSNVAGGWDWDPYESDRTEGLISSVPNPNEGEDVSEYVPRQLLFQKYDHTTSVPPAVPFCRTTTTLVGMVAFSTYAHPLQTMPAPFSSEGPDAFVLWSHPSNPGKVWLTGRKPGARAAFKLHTSALGRVRVTYLRSESWGLGSAWCWIDDDRQNGQRLDGYWKYKNAHVTNTHVVVKNATPGEHILYCEILEDTTEPGGATGFRISAVDAL
ncbi:hypothetical protein GGU11DRAFT_780235 [Lentinula aff. detonsa]|nr:hypothetical protein GGU11DRAFT_780235 [Lentinula aff. detonsa]